MKNIFYEPDMRERERGLQRVGPRVEDIQDLLGKHKLTFFPYDVLGFHIHVCIRKSRSSSWTINVGEMFSIRGK